MSRCRLLAALPVCLLAAACGGSTHHTGSATTATSTSPTTSTTIPSTSSVASATPSSPTTTSTASRPPQVPAGKAHRKTHIRPIVDSGASVAAALVIGAAGKLTPPTISVPSKVVIALAISDHDHAAHLVLVSAPHRYLLHVKPGGDASVRIPGLPDGTYRIVVDGVARGELSVGAQGGP
jgi:hypothetical protein